MRKKYGRETLDGRKIQKTKNYTKNGFRPITFPRLRGAHKKGKHKRPMGNNQHTEK